MFFPIAAFNNEGHARFLEHALITAIPNLLNRDIESQKKALAADDARKAANWNGFTNEQKAASWRPTGIAPACRGERRTRQ
jgi:hypothetical protein